MSILFPYNCVKDFIETHPVVSMSKVSPFRVHAAMVQVLEVEAERARQQRSQQISRSRQDVDAREHYRCKNCNNCEYEINSREAEIVCRSCGATSKHVDAETCMYYTERISQTSEECLDDTRLERAVRDEILHWVHMPGSLLYTSFDQINRTVERALLINRGSVAERAVCALLFPVITGALDIASIETKMRQKEQLPIMAAVKRCAPSHACVTCGESFSEKWCLRRHKCNQSYGKKRQRYC